MYIIAIHNNQIAKFLPSRILILYLIATLFAIGFTVFAVARIAFTVWIITHDFLLVKYLFALSTIFFPCPSNSFILRTAISAVSYRCSFTEPCSFLYFNLCHFFLYAAYDVPDPEIITPLPTKICTPLAPE